MGIFAISFLLIGLLTFGMILFFLRPTTDEKALTQRVTRIKTERNEFGGAASELDQYLKARQEVSWIEELVQNIDLARRVQTLIVQSNSTTTLGSVAIKMACMAVGAAIITYLFTRNLLFTGIAFPIAGYLPIAYLSFFRGRRLRAFDHALPDAIDMMARSLRAGHSLPAAISIVAEQAMEPAKAEFSEVFKQQNYGLPMRDALMQLLDRIPSQDLRVVVTGMLVQKDTGGNLAEILDRIAHVIRERVRIQREIRTHTAQGRLTGWILCMLPVVMLLLVNMMSPGYSKVLFEEGPGRTMLYMGVGLLLMGGFLIRAIINGIEV